MPLTESAKPTDILELARTKVLDQGIGLDQGETLQVLQLGDDRITEILELAHQVRLKWCGEEIEAEGIISLKTGGCPEDCHFCGPPGWTLLDSSRPLSKPKSRAPPSFALSLRSRARTTGS